MTDQLKALFITKLLKNISFLDIMYKCPESFERIIFERTISLYLTLQTSLDFWVKKTVVQLVQICKIQFWEILLKLL